MKLLADEYHLSRGESRVAFSSHNVIRVAAAVNKHVMFPLAAVIVYKELRSQESKVIKEGKYTPKNYLHCEAK